MTRVALRTIERRRTVDGIEQLVGVQPEPHVDVEAGAAHRLEAALGQLLGDEDPRGIEAGRSPVRPQPCQAPRDSAIRSTPSTRSSSPRANERRA